MRNVLKKKLVKTQEKPKEVLQENPNKKHTEEENVVKEEKTEEKPSEVLQENKEENPKTDDKNEDKTKEVLQGNPARNLLKKKNLSECCKITKILK